ncbi:hypothetical protein TERTU_4501 [Teredinibacter turnerae T7901]|uniref:Roadblock/LAMTOR2 domain-containing protein n=1 Tax=Teredinibacter turnerae (strain ATCC 39867 / T7901) TaxID=377629 RepID=C5BJ85_TERTT|nr:roadblock/LC7 domain-containing protein [Teredinibacter turnerae]ACR10818.1 hypothetical protein TERTU_4501 [Teredinibacter turnerae T7901]
MSQLHLKRALLELSLEHGVIGCALVATDTGFVFASTLVQSEFEIIAESARDYWILHTKNTQAFDRLGDVRNISVQHQKGLLNVQPCDDQTLLVTLAKLGHVQWQNWPEKVANLAKNLSVSAN